MAGSVIPATHSVRDAEREKLETIQKVFDEQFQKLFNERLKTSDWIEPPGRAAARTRTTDFVGEPEQKIELEVAEVVPVPPKRRRPQRLQTATLDDQRNN